MPLLAVVLGREGQPLQSHVEPTDLIPVHADRYLRLRPRKAGAVPAPPKGGLPEGLGPAVRERREDTELDHAATSVEACDLAEQLLVAEGAEPEHHVHPVELEVGGWLQPTNVERGAKWGGDGQATDGHEVARQDLPLAAVDELVAKAAAVTGPEA